VDGAAPLRIFTESRDAVLGGSSLTLTRREYDLLLFLAEHPGRVFTRPQLLKWVWGHSIISGERTVDVHVRRLRAKLRRHGPTITTVRGVGYRLDDATRVAVVDGHRYQGVASKTVP
jgi:DNA-binding response OmpR family regulator